MPFQHCYRVFPKKRPPPPKKKRPGALFRHDFPKKTRPGAFFWFRNCIRVSVYQSSTFHQKPCIASPFYSSFSLMDLFHQSYTLFSKNPVWVHLFYTSILACVVEWMKNVQTMAFQRSAPGRFFGKKVNDPKNLKSAPGRFFGKLR